MGRMLYVGKQPKKYEDLIEATFSYTCIVKNIPITIFFHSLSGCRATRRRGQPLKPPLPTEPLLSVERARVAPHQGRSRDQCAGALGKPHAT